MIGGHMNNQVEMQDVIHRLKRKGYSPVGSDKYGVYLQNDRTRVYVDHIGIFVYRRAHSKAPWIRESGHCFMSIPWEHI